MTFIFPDDLAAKRLNLTWYLYFSEVHRSLLRWGFYDKWLLRGSTRKNGAASESQNEDRFSNISYYFRSRGLDEFYFFLSFFLSRWVLTRWVFWDCEVWLFMVLLGNFVCSLWFCVLDLFRFFLRKEDWFICCCGFFGSYLLRLLLKHLNSTDSWNERWNLRNLFLTCGDISK